MIDSNILYDENNDSLYILIYKIGKGAYSHVWFSIEILNFISNMKKKRLDITTRALKIHLDDSYEEGIMETKVLNLLSNKNKKSKYINYPLSHFIYDNETVIVVYELAVGSLYDILKKCNKNLDLIFLNKIIPQLIEAVKDVHYFNYIHTDIKPENFLFMGLDKKQTEILSYVKNYGLYEKLKKISTLNKFRVDDVLRIIKEPIKKMLILLSKKFSLKDNILNNDDDSDNKSETNNESTNKFIVIDNKLSSFYSNISDEYNSDDYDTNVSSYDSRDDEYDNELDDFHTREIIRHQYLLNNNCEENVNQISEDLIKLMVNPVIKLTDFGTMIKNGDMKKTVQTRYYRAVEVILGLKCNQAIDIWSIGCTIYELAIGKIMVYTCKDKYKDIFDVDLINIKIIMEKIPNNERYNLFELIKKSNRKNYIYNHKGYLKFFDNIKNSNWKDDLNQKFGFDSYNLEKIIENMLKINPNQRNM